MKNNFSYICEITKNVKDMNDFVVVAIFNNQRETMKLRSVLERKKNSIHYSRWNCSIGWSIQSIGLETLLWK